MNILRTSLTALLTAAFISSLAFAQNQAASPGASPGAMSAQPNEAEMMAKMMELAKPGENHKMLADLAGTWSYTVKMWMNPDPQAPPMTSTGTAIRKPITGMGGRYFQMDVTGHMKMPGADGKMKDMEFKGMSIEGYDNVKQKFVGSWIDNMGTMIMMSEGT
jgi:hypothetical protein